MCPQASSKDAGQLAAALHHRILALRSRVEQEAESAPLPAEPEIPQSNEDDSDDDQPANNSSGTGNSTASGTGFYISDQRWNSDGYWWARNISVKHNNQ